MTRRPRRPAAALVRAPASGPVVAVLVLVVGFLAPTGLSYPAQGALAVFCFAIVLWLDGSLPLSVVSVLSVTLLVVLGVTDSFAEAAAGFASRLVFFMFLLLVLGGAISTVGLDRWVASRLLSGSSTPRRSYWLLARDVLVLSLFMPSGIARTVTFVPIVERLGERYGLAPTDAFQSSSFLLLGQLNPVASLMIMTGGGMAILSSEIIRTTTPVSWLGWFVFMMPPAVLIYVLGALAVTRIFAIDDSVRAAPTASSDGGDERDGDGGRDADAVRAPPGTPATDATGTADTGVDEAAPDDLTGPADLTRDQRLVGGVMLGTILLWVVGSPLGLSSIVPPLLAVCLLAAPGVGVVTTRDVRNVNWDVLLLFGGVFSLTKVLESTGAIAAVVDALLSVVALDLLSTPAAVAAVLGFVFVVRLFFSTASACLAATLPVVLSLAPVVGVDPLWLALSAVTLAGSTTLLPFHLPTVLLITERHETPTTRHVLLLGVANCCFCALALLLAWTLYWPLVG